MMARGLPLLLLVAMGCHRGAKTPDEAFREVERAIAAGDGVSLHKYLDRTTRWSVEAAYKDQRLQRTIIEAKYPEEEQARALQAVEAAAAPDAAHYFAKVSERMRIYEQFRKRLGSVSGPIKHKPDGEDAMWVARQDGAPLHFVKDSDGNWGFDELRVSWQLEKDRASHAVKTVRENATLYNKAEK
jgi:hypothetical protein